MERELERELAQRVVSLVFMELGDNLCGFASSVSSTAPDRLAALKSDLEQLVASEFTNELNELTLWYNLRISRLFN